VVVGQETVVSIIFESVAWYGTVRRGVAEFSVNNKKVVSEASPCINFKFNKNGAK